MNDLEQLQAKYGAERVLVVDKELLSELDILDGLESTYLASEITEEMNKEDVNKSVHEKVQKLIEGSYFKNRYESEHNPEVVQIIPYPVIRTVTSNKVFVTKRLSGRLKDEISIGTGGHINEADKDSDGVGDILVKCMHRELNEELEIPFSSISKSVLQMRGIINDNSNEVSKEHVCILFHIIIPDDTTGYEVKETHKLEGRFEDIAKVKKLEGLESWSELALSTLIETK